MTFYPEPYASRIVDEMTVGPNPPPLPRSEILREVGAAFTLTAPSVRPATAYVVAELVRKAAPFVQATRAISAFGKAFAEIDASVLNSTARVVALTMDRAPLVSDVEAAIRRIGTALADRSPLV